MTHTLRHPGEGPVRGRKAAFIKALRAARIPAFAGVAVLALMQCAHAENLIDKKACQYLVAHEPAGDVAYRPGVDVHGKPVVEADIAPPVVTVPEDFSFDVTVDVARAAGLPVPPGTEMAMKAGTVTYKDGRFRFNGKPLEGEAEANLRALCTEKQEEEPTGE